jgi:hypothetical protein
VGRGSDRVRRGSDRVRPGSDRVGHVSDRVGRGSDRVRRGSDRVGRGSDRVRRGSGRVWHVSDWRQQNISANKILETTKYWLQQNIGVVLLPENLHTYFELSVQAWTLYKAPQWKRYPNSCPERIKLHALRLRTKAFICGAGSEKMDSVVKT